MTSRTTTTSTGTTGNALTRRTVLAGACGTCAVAVAGCAALTTGTPAAAPQPAATPAPAPAPAAPAGIPTKSVPVKGGIVLADQGIVVTQPKAGTFKAFSATCTHQGCTVNTVKNGVIGCPCHGSTFAIATGAVVHGPAKKPLAAKKVTVKGSTLTVT